MRISDWSSDVCSSDLLDCLVNNAAGNFLARSETLSPRAVDAVLAVVLHGTAYVTLACGKRWLAEERAGTVLSIVATYAETRSAERRVGNEGVITCSSRWPPCP